MKKLIVYLLCTLLALAPCAGALAETSNAVLGVADEANPDGLNFRAYFAYEDMLYLITNKALYTYTLGDDALEKYDFPTEDEDHPADEYEVSCLVFAGSEGLYGVRVYTDIEDDYNFDEAIFGEVTLEDGQVVFDDGKKINWDDMVMYYDDFSMAATVQGIVCMDDMAYMLYYGTTLERQLACLDLDRGKLEQVEDVPAPTFITPYKDGKLLLETMETSGGDAEVSFIAYDPEEEETETLGSGTVEGDKGIQAIAYDPETDVLYGVRNGQISVVDVTTCALGDPVNNLPVAISEFGSAGAMLPGSIYAYAERGLALRDMNAEHRPTSTLTIHNSVWDDSTRKAYYDFMKTHEDVGAAMLEEIFSNTNLVDDMMKQDDSVDIYVMTCNSSLYDAVRNRGYMLELDDCPNVQTLAEEMYPTFREAMTYNGHVVAVPVRVSCGDISVNTKALDLLGLTIDDVPTSWEGLLDFLDELAEDWDLDSDVSIAAEFASEQQARSTLLLLLLMAYQRYSNISETPLSFNSEKLHEMVDHLYKIDFEALGCEHLEDETPYAWSSEFKQPLFTFSGRNAALGSWDTGSLPVLLSIEEGGEPCMIMDCSVAFVNPFTKNPKAALEYMDQLAVDLQPKARYNVVPTMDEPVRDASVETKIAELEKKLKKREADLEDVEAVDEQEIEDDIENIKAEIELQEQRVWSISAEQIEWFRAHDDNMRMGGVNWLLSSDGGEAFELLSQFLRDQISLNELLNGIDQKIQMRMKEGN